MMTCRGGWTPCKLPAGPQDPRICTRFHPTPATTTQNVPNPTHSTLPTADTSEVTIKAERNETSMLIVAHV